LAAGTIAPRRRSIILFLKWLGPQATLAGLSKLTAAQVETLFLTHSPTMAKHTRSVVQTALRTFFRCYQQKGTITLPLENVVPHQKRYTLTTVPRAISDEHAKTLL
jgi:site-specific recombinase XerD